MDKEWTSLIAVLEELAGRYNEIERQISDPGLARDTAKLITLSKERGRNRPLVAKYREYQKVAAGIEEAQQILGEAACSLALNDKIFMMVFAVSNKTVMITRTWHLIIRNQSRLHLCPNACHMLVDLIGRALRQRRVPKHN